MRRVIGMCALLLAMVAGSGCIIALGTGRSYCPKCRSYCAFFGGKDTIVEVDEDGVLVIEIDDTDDDDD